MAIAPRILSRPDFRFELRPFNPSCTAELYEAIDESRERISPWMGWLHANYQRQDAENWTAYAMKAWAERREFEFAIYDREDGKVTGCCGLNGINGKDKFCNLGYWVRSSKARLGAATQAVKLLEDFGFGELGLNRIEIVAADGNQASRGVAEKAGAFYEGLHRSRVCVGERVLDAHMYALIKPRG